MERVIQTLRRYLDADPAAGIKDKEKSEEVSETKRAVKVIVIIIFVVYAVLLLGTSVFFPEPKGTPAWKEWQGEGKSLWLW